LKLRIPYVALARITKARGTKGPRRRPGPSFGRTLGNSDLTRFARLEVRRGTSLEWSPSPLRSPPIRKSALLRAAFLVRAFLNVDWHRSQCADVALRDGTRVEGRRGLGMATPWAAWPSPTPTSLINPCEKSI